MKVLLMLLNTLFWYSFGSNDVRPLRCYSFYTPSHEIFKKDWFLSTIKDNYEIIINFAEQECLTARYGHEGWKKTTLKKVENIINAVQENMGRIFVYFDIDIQFFGKTQKLIEYAMKDKDIVFQRDTPTGTLCSGCFACFASKKTLAYWKGVHQHMVDHDCSDQKAVNALLRSRNPFKIKWGYLPREFFGGGTFTGRQWTPGTSLRVPLGIVLHHANWTYGGIPHKLAQLKYVRHKIKLRNNRHKQDCNVRNC